MKKRPDHVTITKHAARRWRQRFGLPREELRDRAMRSRPPSRSQRKKMCAKAGSVPASITSTGAYAMVDDGIVFVMRPGGIVLTVYRL